MGVHTTQFNIRDAEHDLLETVLTLASALLTACGEHVQVLTDATGALRVAVRADGDEIRVGTVWIQFRALGDASTVTTASYNFV